MFKREIKMHPAWDKRDPDPNKNYGVHGVEMRWLLIGPAGVIQFLVFTNWHLPHVQQEMYCKGMAAQNETVLRVLFTPQPADVGYHSPEPHYEGQTSMGPCEHLDGKPCYYDGSSLAAETMFNLLVREGDEAVWKKMEERYYDTFGGEQIAENGHKPIGGETCSQCGKPRAEWFVRGCSPKDDTP